MLIIQQMSKNKISIGNLSLSDDTQIMQQLLAKRNESAPLDVHHAGTVMRFLTAFLAASPGKYLLTGSERMQQRPVKELVDTLISLGAEIKYLKNEGYPPLEISGKILKGGKASITANISSQFISALMLIAPGFELGLELSLTGKMVSQPYILMTAGLMKKFGAEVKMTENRIIVPPGEYSGGAYAIESDWSAASYFYSLVALSTSAKIKLMGFRKNSFQGDAVLPEIYSTLGVRTTYSENEILLEKTDFSSSKFEFDFLRCPDLAQAVVVTCAGLGIEAHCSGLETLRIKETDRLYALQNELKKFNLQVKITDADLILSPGKIKYSCEPVKTYDDHRMAMAFAPLALVQPLYIESPQVVSKSYPAFWNDLEKLGIMAGNADI